MTPECSRRCSGCCGSTTTSQSCFHPRRLSKITIILDINLPDGSGIELRENLKVAGVCVPVIYMTGNANSMVREAALASGCIAFLAKPFAAHELITPLKKVSAGNT